MSNHVKNHMPLVQLGQPGKRGHDGSRVDCDYCADDAVWFHWASKFTPPDRDCYACDFHVGLLNDFYGDGAW